MDELLLAEEIEGGRENLMKLIHRNKVRLSDTEELLNTLRKNDS